MQHSTSQKRRSGKWEIIKIENTCPSLDVCYFKFCPCTLRSLIFRPSCCDPSCPMPPCSVASRYFVPSCSALSCSSASCHVLTQRALRVLSLHVLHLHVPSPHVSSLVFRPFMCCLFTFLHFMFRPFTICPLKSSVPCFSITSGSIFYITALEFLSFRVPLLHDQSLTVCPFHFCLFYSLVHFVSYIYFPSRSTPSWIVQLRVRLF
jgi:hypothetical protein